MNTKQAPMAPIPNATRNHYQLQVCSDHADWGNVGIPRSLENARDIAFGIGLRGEYARVVTRTAQGQLLVLRSR